MTSIIKLSASTLFFCCLAQFSHALILGQPSIPSTKERILYMELPYTEAVNSKSIQAGLADGEDVSTLGIKNKDLNFTVRKTTTSRGVIIITSSKPIRHDRVNFVIRVKELDTPYFKRIDVPFKTIQANKNEEHSLTPIKIRSEQEISSNLNSTQKTAVVEKAETVKSTTPAKKNTLLSYPVQSDETLWSIASKISVQTNQPIFKILKTIKSNNVDAFTELGGNELKEHTVLNIPRSYFNKKQIREIEKRQQNFSAQVKSTSKDTASSEPATTSDSSAFVTKNQSAVQPRHSKITKKTKPVPTVRQEVRQIKVRMESLEREITHLERELKQKDAKLDIINVRLAQLRKQLRKLNSRIAT